MARRASAARLARFASETNVFGQSLSCNSCFERARGRFSNSSSKSRNALGETWTGPPARKSSRVSESNVQSPKTTRIKRKPEECQEFPKTSPAGKGDRDYRPKDKGCPALPAGKEAAMAAR